jgi:hypothetical protein
MNKIEEYGVDRAFESSLFGELREQWIRNRFIMDTGLLRKPSLKELSAASFLSVVESDIPVNLICSQMLFEMKKLASCFTGTITSFFWF